MTKVHYGHPEHGYCNCGKIVPSIRGKPLCPHCHCYQGKDGCNDCECIYPREEE